MEFKDYYLLDKVKIGPYTFEVILSGASGSYYLNGESHSGGQIFKHLGVEKQAYVMSIVGYECRGLFPEVKTLEDLNKVIKQLQIDYLIKEAKEKYPVGTKYYPAHMGKCDGNFVVMDDQEIIFRYNRIYLINPDETLYSSRRNDSTYNQTLYSDNRWAEIITEEPNQPEINTYVLKVGDTLKKDVISAWVMQGPNRYQSEENSGKWGKGVNFIGDRKIESFKVIDGTVGFLVSGTNEVYLRAEGFKEFAEGFNKSVFQFEVGKWYKQKRYNYAIKYLKKEVRNSKYAIVYSDIIKSNGEHISFPEGSTGVGYVEEGSWYEITDLSEIQEYLPDGHPDKITKKKYTLQELVDDKIIVYIDSQEEFDKITKAGKKIKGFISTSEYYCKCCYNFKLGNYASNSSKTNIGAYDPGCIIITIDDIIFPEESMNYVGRYIRILQDNPVGADVKKGDIFQIKRQRDEIIYYSEKEWIMNFHYNLGKLFELMPEDCNPDVSAIRINPNTDFIFEPNGYYVGEWEQEGNERVIFKTTTNKLSDPCYSIDTTNVYQYSKTGCCTAPDITFRKANQDEIQWLDECIKQGKTIPYEMAMVNKKSVNKWSPGTYVFIEKKVPGILVPELSIHKINLFKDDCIHIHGDCLHIDREEDGQIKWFATLKEAEAYKLSLIGTIGSDFSKQEYLQAYPISFDDSIFTDEQKQLNNIKDDKPIIDINKYQVDLSVKSALETNYKYFNNN